MTKTRDQIVRAGPRNAITDIVGIKVGTAHDAKARTGVSVIIPDKPAIAACAIPGGAPGTRETDLLKAENLVAHADAIVLSGGSVFGLEAASSLTTLLAAKGRGFVTGAPLPSPIVPAAILFDVANGGDKNWGKTPPYAHLSQSAYAARDVTVELGNVGAGYGAQAGQLKGGQGSASAQMDTIMVGALVAANPFGAVVDADGRFFAQPLAMMYEGALEFGFETRHAQAAQIGGQHPLTASKRDNSNLENMTAAQNTSIGVVAVEADLTVAEAHRVAIMAQDGLARAIRPVHTPFDGDAIFVLATCSKPLAENADMRPAALAILGALAADCVARAVARAVWAADNIGDMKAYRNVFSP